LVLFTRQLAALLAAGLPLMDSLGVLERQATSQGLQRIVLQLRTDVGGGEALSEAMQQHRKTFSPLYTGMVAAGESSGMLDEVLLRLAGVLERSEALSRKIRAAMLYPLVVLGVALVSVLLLLILVIPTFEGMFSEAGLPLPLPTQWVLALSRGLAAGWWVILAVAGSIGVGLMHSARTAAGQTWWDRQRIRMPLLGAIQRKAGAARFARILGTLLAAGVPLVEGLTVSAQTAGNRVLQATILGARGLVLSGIPLAQALEEAGDMPSLLIQMVQVGEQTGALDEMLSRVANLFEEEVEAGLSTLVSLLEPSLVILMGLIVGGMVVAMYLPIFDLVGMVG
jgi:type IV pilus assembly protein PilC